MIYLLRHGLDDEDYIGGHSDVDLIDEDIYYVPVTKYINDDREKVKIIIEELKSSYLSEVNLMSFLNSNVNLIDYNVENLIID